MQNTCLIIPCYNEAKRLNIELFSDFLQRNDNVTLCFVNDGSTDETLAVLDTVKNNNLKKVIILNSDKNSGKAEAVRKGVLHISKLNLFEFIGYWDADASTPLEELRNFLELFGTKEKILFMMGSRMKRLGSVIERKRMRHISGRVFATFASNILRLPVYDSQCGAKLFRAEISQILFADPFISKWLFDVELLARLRNDRGNKKILEVCYELPLKKWIDVGGSKLRFSHLLKVPFDLLKIYFHYNKENNERV